MNLTQHSLLTIGAFAQAAQLSNKALRIYAELGLLAPSYIDPESGYRYYHTNQLQQARLIRLLRQIDMPLITIPQVLVAAPADAELIVKDYWQTREAHIAQARQLCGRFKNQQHRSARQTRLMIGFCGFIAQSGIYRSNRSGRNSRSACAISS